VVLTASVGSSYLWSNGATTQSIIVTTAGSYTVQVTNANGCQSSASAATVVTVIALPTAPISGNTSFCTGGNTVLTSTATAGSGTISSYQWKVGGVNVASGGTSATYTATAAESYTVTVTNSNGCSFTSSPYVISVNALPTASISGNTSFCTGGNTVLTSTATAGSGTISSYQWKIGGVNVASAGTSATYTATAAGSYTVTVTNSNGCSVTSAAHVVTASPILSSFAPSNGNVGSSVVITGSGFTGTTAVLFNGVSASFVVDNSNTITAIVPAGATTGTISVTVNGVCTIVSPTPFTVNASTITLNLNVFVQGFYLGNGLMKAVLFNRGIVTDPTACDYITVELRESLNPSNPAVSSTTTILHTDGTAQTTLPLTINGGDYYIVIKHRNTTETWSKNPVTFTSVTNFDFTH
jgi:hypothetical protein